MPKHVIQVNSRLSAAEARLTVMLMEEAGMDLLAEEAHLPRLRGKSDPKRSAAARQKSIQRRAQRRVV